MAAKQSKNYTLITLWLWDEHCPNDQLISRGLGCLEYTSEGYNLKRGSYTRASSMLKSFWHKLNFFLLRAAETRETSPVANETRLVLWPSCTYSISKTLNMVLQQFRNWTSLWPRYNFRNLTQFSIRQEQLSWYREPLNTSQRYDSLLGGSIFLWSTLRSSHLIPHLGHGFRLLESDCLLVVAMSSSRFRKISLARGPFGHSKPNQ